ncbi:hypothetical protein AMJ86_00805 [bacterium SM23_57]|nr:MAG: hypothetical protein AMJ86_00805 [bacterium SM23_57]
MILNHSTDQLVYMNLGAVDCLTVAALRFIAIRKNTDVEVEIAILIIYQDHRWIVFRLDGSDFEIGEHIYRVVDNSDNVLETGILIIKNGYQEPTGYHPSIEGEKGEYN